MLSLPSEVGPPASLSALLGALGAKPSGTGWSALCPAHSDSNPSLSLWIEDALGIESVAIKCHAGCARRDVLSAVGLSAKRLAHLPIDVEDYVASEGTQTRLSSGTGATPRTLDYDALRATAEGYVAALAQGNLVDDPGARAVMDRVASRHRDPHVEMLLHAAVDQTASATVGLASETKTRRDGETWVDNRLAIIGYGRDDQGTPTPVLMQTRDLRPDGDPRYRWMTPPGNGTRAAGAFIPFDADGWVNTSVVLTEGLTDALTVQIGLGLPAVAVRGGSITSSAVGDVLDALGLIEAMASDVPAVGLTVIIAGDMDSTGTRFREFWTEQLMRADRFLIRYWEAPAEISGKGADLTEQFAALGAHSVRVSLGTGPTHLPSRRAARDRIERAADALAPVNVSTDVAADLAPTPPTDVVTITSDTPLESPTFGVAPVTDPRATGQIAQLDLPQTGFGFAERWALYEGPSWRASQSPASEAVLWYRWDGQRWGRTSTSHLRHSIVSTARHIAKVESIEYGRDAAKTALERIINSGVDSGEKTPEEAAAAAGLAAARHLAEWAREFEEKHRQDAVMAELTALRGILVDPRHWDANPYLLNTPTGVIDLSSGERQAHDRDLLITQITRGSGLDVPMTPALTRLLAGYAESGKDIPDFMGVLSGIELTGFSPGLFSHIWGAAGCGKSSLAEAKVNAYGDYAATISVKVLEKRSGGGGDTPDPTLHVLQRVRFVYVDEAAGKQLEADLLKTMSSGGEMRTRALHQSSLSWQSQVTLGMSGNGRLRLPDSDPGIARRFFPIRLTSVPAHPDPKIQEELKSQAGADAILAWAIRHAVRWVQGGRRLSDAEVPKCVLDERSSYLSELDPLGTWWEENVEELSKDATVDKAKSPTAIDLHSSYSEWCSDHRVRFVIGIREFQDRLSGRGHEVPPREKRGARRGRFLDGLRLLNVRADDADY